MVETGSYNTLKTNDSDLFSAFCVLVIVLNMLHTLTNLASIQFYAKGSIIIPLSI